MGGCFPGSLLLLGQALSGKLGQSLWLCVLSVGPETRDGLPIPQVTTTSARVVLGGPGVRGVPLVCGGRPWERIGAHCFS